MRTALRRAPPARSLASLRDPALVEERRALLTGDQSRLFSPLFLEPVLPYDGVAGVVEAAWAA